MAAIIAPPFLYSRVLLSCHILPIQLSYAEGEHFPDEDMLIINEEIREDEMRFRALQFSFSQTSIHSAF